MLAPSFFARPSLAHNEALRSALDSLDHCPG
jgi:hypothetical protein